MFQCIGHVFRFVDERTQCGKQSAVRGRFLFHQIRVSRFLFLDCLLLLLLDDWWWRRL